MRVLSMHAMVSSSICCKPSSIKEQIRWHAVSQASMPSLRDFAVEERAAVLGLCEAHLDKDASHSKHSPSCMHPFTLCKPCQPLFVGSKAKRVKPAHTNQLYQHETHVVWGKGMHCTTPN